MKTSAVAWTALGIRIRIQIQEGQNDPHKSEENSSFEELDVFFFEG
jgi:hypothetical protein